MGSLLGKDLETFLYCMADATKKIEYRRNRKTIAGQDGIKGKKDKF